MTEDDGADGRDHMWGRFPIEQRYNMYQANLNFFNYQDDTFTMEDKNKINIKCPK